MTWLERTIGRGVWGVAVEKLADIPDPVTQFALGLLVGLLLLLTVTAIHRAVLNLERGRRVRGVLNWLASMACILGVAWLMTGCAAVQAPRDGGVYFVDHSNGRIEVIK